MTNRIELARPERGTTQLVFGPPPGSAARIDLLFETPAGPLALALRNGAAAATIELDGGVPAPVYSADFGRILNGALIALFDDI